MRILARCDLGDLVWQETNFSFSPLSGREKEPEKAKLIVMVIRGGQKSHLYIARFKLHNSACYLFSLIFLPLILGSSHVPGPWEAEG